MRRNTRKTEVAETPSMDPSVGEVPNTTENPRVFTNHPRECYSLTTLVAEVHAIAPEVTYEADNADVTNAALDVTFSGCDSRLISVLNLLRGDARIEHTISNTEEGLFYVSFYANAVTKDSRETYNLADALVVLGDVEGT